MHRVEDLTGRDLRSTADVVELWLALRALEFSLGEVGPDPTEGA
jgi:DNA-binding PucR family transcriptional regulator